MSIAQILSNYVTDLLMREVSREFRYYMKYPFDKLTIDDTWLKNDNLDHLVCMHDSILNHPIGFKVSQTDLAIAKLLIDKLFSSCIAKYIVTLDLSQCYGTANDIFFPIESNITSLNLSNLRIGDNVQNILCNLKSLKHLNLSDNKICKWSLSGLRSLNLKNNDLSEIYIPSTITYLNLKGNNVTTLDFEGKTNIEYLNLSRNYIRSLPALNLLSELRKFKLAGTYINIDSLKDGLKNTSKLIYLDISCNGFHSMNAAKIADILKNTPYLQTLKISKNFFGEIGAKILKSTMSTLTRMIHLDISCTGIHSDSLDLTCYTNLQTLKMGRNYMNFIDISQFPSSLTSLCLKSNNIDEINLESLKLLINLDLSNNNLQSISLNHRHLKLLKLGLNDLCDESFVCYSANLTYLDLSGNKLHGNADSLRTLTNLRTLNIGINNLEVNFISCLTNLLDLRLEHKNINVVHLAQIFRANTKIKHLRLGFNGLCLHGIIYLAPVLGKLQNLIDFRFSNNDIGPKGAIHLGNVLKQLKNVIFLELEGNRFGRYGIKTLIPVFLSMQKLRYLTLYNNNLSYENIIEAQEILSKKLELII